MAKHGSIYTSAIPTEGTQDNAQRHPRQKSHKLHMKSGKKKSSKNDSGPGRFEYLDKKFLQNTSEKKFFANSRECPYQEDGSQQVGRTLHGQNIFQRSICIGFPAL